MTTTTQRRLPRGIRNNNPGNIRKSPTKWRGEVEGVDDAFETFATPEMGIRAMCRILLTYSRRYGLTSVRDIIERWAPPIENDADSYVMTVADALNVSPFHRLNVEDERTLRMLVRAIIRHENGQQPYPDEVINAGVRLALG